MRLLGRGAALLAVALAVPACMLTFTTDDPGTLSMGPQDPFALMVPVNHATGVFTTHTQFAWGAMPGAVTYELQVSLTSDFSQIVEDQPGLTITQAFSASTFTTSTSYYWRVIGSDGVTTRFAVGSPSVFTTVPPLSPPGPFFMQSPSGSGVSRTPQFDWTASANVSSYTLQLALNSDPVNPLFTLGGLHVTQAGSPITLLPTTIYTWQVTATNFLGVYAAPSATFTTGP